MHTDDASVHRIPDSDEALVVSVFEGDDAMVSDHVVILNEDTPKDEIVEREGDSVAHIHVDVRELLVARVNHRTCHLYHHMVNRRLLLVKYVLNSFVTFCVGIVGRNNTVTYLNLHV